MCLQLQRYHHHHMLHSDVESTCVCKSKLTRVFSDFLICLLSAFYSQHRGMAWHDIAWCGVNDFAASSSSLLSASPSYKRRGNGICTICNARTQDTNNTCVQQQQQN